MPIISVRVDVICSGTPSTGAWPAYGAPRTTSRILVHATPQYVGMNLIHLYDLNGVEKLKCFMLHFRRFDYTGHLMRIASQWTQLWTGTERPFLHLQYEDYHHLTPSTWVSHLWQHVGLRQLTIDTTRSYCFSKQRHNDAFIVDLLRPHFNPTQLKYINRFRLSLKLLRVPDMVDCRGKDVLFNIQYCISSRDSSLLWPNQPLPKKNRALWSKACKTIFRGTCQHNNWGFGCIVISHGPGAPMKMGWSLAMEPPITKFFIKTRPPIFNRSSRLP